jgi:hypothetical protein
MTLVNFPLRRPNAVLVCSKRSIYHADSVMVPDRASVFCHSLTCLIRFLCERKLPVRCRGRVHGRSACLSPEMHTCGIVLQHPSECPPANWPCTSSSSAWPWTTMKVTAAVYELQLKVHLWHYIIYSYVYPQLDGVKIKRRKKNTL